MDLGTTEVQTYKHYPLGQREGQDFTFLSEDGLRDTERTYRPINIISWDREGQTDVPFHVFLSGEGLRDTERTYRPINIVPGDREGQDRHTITRFLSGETDVPFQVLL